MTSLKIFGNRTMLSFFLWRWRSWREKTTETFCKELAQWIQLVSILEWWCYYKSPLNFWISARSKLKVRVSERCKMHHSAVAAMGNFMLIKRREATAINIKLSQVRNGRIQQNREKLIPIIKTVAFCGRQNIAFRGHRDDETLEETTWNKSNFCTCLDFSIDSGDTVLQHQFDTAPKNATYKSKTIQNEIVDCIGSCIRDQIINEVKDAKLFSVMADETPDVPRKEQFNQFAIMSGVGGGAGILTPKTSPCQCLQWVNVHCKSTCRKVFYLFIIASHIGTARAGIGYTTSVREHHVLL